VASLSMGGSQEAGGIRQRNSTGPLGGGGPEKNVSPLDAQGCGKFQERHPRVQRDPLSLDQNDRVETEKQLSKRGGPILQTCIVPKEKTKSHPTEINKGSSVGEKKAKRAAGGGAEKILMKGGTRV